MDWLDEELRRALERKEPSADFSARVAAATRPRASRKLPRWAAVAASVVILAGAGGGYQWQRGVRAKKDVILAMRIAGQKLNQVQNHISEVGR